MKELSIEEKAKAYDEAIEKAKEYFNSPRTCFDIEQLCNIFPELTESDDERIRKEMIEILKKEAHDFPSSIIAEKSNSWIAYLEKQGEQKPVFEMITPEESLGVDSDTYNKIIDECIYGEQKPAEWSEEDEKMFSQISDILWEGYKNTTGEMPTWDNIREWCLSLKDRCLPQPKQEWSEEDEEELELATGTLLNAGQSSSAQWVEDLSERLKSLRPQKQKEWTKGDIEMIDWLIRCCKKEHEELCNDKYGHQDIVSELKRDCRKKWNWLESLKNKVVPQNTWKPSEGQLECLGYVIEKAEKDWSPLTNNRIYLTLKALKEQLEKL